MAKYGHVREGGKVGRSDATPTNFFSVDSNNLKSMSFKFGNDIFVTFEMLGVAYSMSFDKIHISLQFRPSEDSISSSTLIINGLQHVLHE